MSPCTDEAADLLTLTRARIIDAFSVGDDGQPDPEFRAILESAVPTERTHANAAEAARAARAHLEALAADLAATLRARADAYGARVTHVDVIPTYHHGGAELLELRVEADVTPDVTHPIPPDRPAAPADPTVAVTLPAFYGRTQEPHP